MTPSPETHSTQLRRPRPRGPGSAALSLVAEAIRRMFFDVQAEFWLSELDPSWSARELRARVVAIRQETPDTRTFDLQPNALWRGHRAGQFVTVGVEIDGVRTHRCYSLSSAPAADDAGPGAGDAAGLVSITVKRVPGGRVSNWLHDHLEVGDVLYLSEAAGAFVVPTPAPERLLFVAGGSGVTPILAILEDLASRDLLGDAVLVDYARSAADLIGRSRLDALQARAPGLRVRYVLDDDPEGPGGFEATHFATLVPDFAERDTWLCGPPGLMERAEATFCGAGAAGRLRTERFVAPRVAAAESAGAAVTISLLKTQLDLAGVAAGTLLEQLERAGRTPAHGCRMGICKTCRTRKCAGVVENALTGELSGDGDEEIPLCISIPRSDVALYL